MIGVIADDLSGAAEIGAVGLRHGLRAEVVIMGDEESLEFRSTSGEVEGDSRSSDTGWNGISNQPSAADLVCVDTDSRSASPEEAARRVVSAVKLLQDAGASWIYKKVDSVLRGRVTAELEAILNKLGLKRALLVPANPSRGRVIEGGRYFIQGQPINETEFASDPEYPRTSAQVLQLLTPASRFRLRVCRANASLPVSGIIVGEVATTDDLQYWARRRTSKMLAAGAAEFFGTLLDRAGHAEVPRSTGQTIANVGAELFVCGTTSQSGRDFLAAARTRRTPIFSLPAELAWNAEFTQAAMEAIAGRVIAALHSHSRVILNVGLPRLRDAAKARPLVLHLVELAGTVLRQAEIGHVYAEGGATAAALMRRMNWHRLSVLRELAPGVATLMVQDDRSMLLTIKPGSYVWPPEVRGETADFPAHV